MADTRERYLLSDVLVGHVAGPSLGDETGPLRFGAATAWLVLVLRQTGQEEAVWQEALPRQHDTAASDTAGLKPTCNIMLFQHDLNRLSTNCSAYKVHIFYYELLS